MINFNTRSSWSRCTLAGALVCILIGVHSIGNAQDESQPDDPKRDHDELLDTNRLTEVSVDEFSEHASHISHEMAKSLQGRGSDRLQAMRERAFQAQELQAKFLEQVASGEVELYEGLKADVERITPQLNDLRSVQEQLNDPTLSGSERERLSKVLFDGLQPIGEWLDSSNSIRMAKSDRILSDAELKEYQRLDRIWRGPDAEDGELEEDEMVSHLRPIGARTSYTLHFLTVPLAVSTDPGTVVYWAAENGGRFQNNNLSLYESVADEEGIATASWVGKGDAEGTADVVVSTPEFSDELHLEVKVVDLRPVSLPSEPAAPRP